jgi:hypothetical protein
LPKIGKKGQQILEENKIATVAEFVAAGVETIKKLIGEKRTDSAMKAAKKAAQGARPLPVDLTKTTNPYEAKYGASEWRNKIRTATSLRAYVCITEMIEHIWAETAKLYEGTKYEDKWYVYHDALTLMTAADTIAWMKEKDMLRRWILPQNGLNSAIHDKDLKAYSNRPVGNCPENMPWDLSLNKDLKDAVDHHVLITSHLPENDERKFSLSTPKRGVSAFIRCLKAMCVSRDRIMADIYRVLNSMRVVVEARGVHVPGIGCRSGSRSALVSPQSQKGSTNNPSGKRKRALDDYGHTILHPDARVVAMARMEDATIKKESTAKTETATTKQNKNEN